MIARIKTLIFELRSKVALFILLDDAKALADWHRLSTPAKTFRLLAEIKNHRPVLQIAAIGMALVSVLLAVVQWDRERFGLGLAIATTFVLYAFVARRRAREAEVQIIALAQQTYGPN